MGGGATGGWRLRLSEPFLFLLIIWVGWGGMAWYGDMTMVGGKGGFVNRFGLKRGWIAGRDATDVTVRYGTCDCDTTLPRYGLFERLEDRCDRRCQSVFSFPFFLFTPKR